jgi:fucose permease
MTIEENDDIIDSQRELHLSNDLSESPKHRSSIERPLTEEFTIDTEDFDLSKDWKSSKIVDFEGHKVILENKNIFQSRKLKFQFLSSMISLFLLGLSDQTIGSLIEYILEEYKIDRVQISYLFIAQFCGYIPSSLLNNYLMGKYGLFLVYSTACMLVVFACTIYSFKAPFIFLPLASICFGWSNGTFDCCLNYYVGMLDYSNELLGLMHALYGVGCLVTPVLSVHLVQLGMDWNHYYYLLICTAFINFLLVIFFFKNETSYKYRYVAIMDAKSDLHNENSDFDPSAVVHEESEPSIWETISNKYIIFYSISLFVYVGTELSVGVWLNNYMFRIQKLTEKKASVITSSFWLFMTLGRAVLGFVTGRYFEDTEIRAIVGYSFLVAFGCLNFWIFESSITLQTIFICFAGFFVGPLFGTTIIIALKSLPKRYSLHGISLIAGFGGTGAAIIPAIVGYISEHFGPSNGDVNDGAGLVYFPNIEFMLFSAAALLWLGFYLYNKQKLDNKVRLT